MAFLPDIQKALTFFEEKGRRNGAGLQEFWGLSAAEALIRTELAGKLGIDHERPMKDAVARVMGIYYKIIASQEDPSMATSLHRLDDEVSGHLGAKIPSSDNLSHPLQRLRLYKELSLVNWTGFRTSRPGLSTTCGISTLMTSALIENVEAALLVSSLDRYCRTMIEL